MKNIMILMLGCLIGQSIHAQKIIEKHIDFTQKKFLSLNIQIADSIHIITWGKNEVYVKTSINVNENKNNDDYKVSFDQSGSTVLVRSKFEFEKGKNCCGTSTNCHCDCNCHSQITCDVFLPENTGFSIETIDGNITIVGKTADIRAHTISGFIDLSIPSERKVDLKMNTISGTMYSDFNLGADEKGIRHVGGNSLTAQLNGDGGKPIDLETISGDIFFRKS